MGTIRIDGLLAEPVLVEDASLRVDGLLLEAPAPQVAAFRVDDILAETPVREAARMRAAGVLLEAFVTILEPGPVTTAIFPAALLALAGFPVHRRPTFSTRVAAHVSGREVRSPNYVYPLREFELTFEALHSGAGIGAIPAETKQLLEGFWCALQGQYGVFLFADPEDDTAVDGAIATGDGATAEFPLVRVVGGYAEPVGQVNALTRVAVNGTALDPATYSLVLPNTLILNAAPAAGAAVTADFTFWWRCRFLDDVTDFEELLSQIHDVQSLKFRSVKP